MMLLNWTYSYRLFILSPVCIQWFACRWSSCCAWHFSVQPMLVLLLWPMTSRVGQADYEVNNKYRDADVNIHYL